MMKYIDGKDARIVGDGGESVLKNGLSIGGPNGTDTHGVNRRVLTQLRIGQGEQAGKHQTESGDS